MGFDFREKLFGGFFSKPKIQDTTPSVDPTFKQPTSPSTEIDQLKKEEETIVRSGTPMDIAGPDAMVKAARLDQIGQRIGELNTSETNEGVNAAVSQSVENTQPAGTTSNTTEKPQ